MTIEPRVFVLDLDGVILDTFRIHVRSWIAIAANFGRDAPESIFEGYKGVATRDALVQLCRELDIEVDDSDLDRLVEVKCSLRDLLVRRISPSDVSPGVKALVHAASIRCERVLCLATTSACEKILDQIQLENYFTDVICGPILHPSKSRSAECLCDWLDSNSLDRRSVLYIDDAETAVRHAMTAGVPSLLKSDQVPHRLGLPAVDSLDGKCLSELMKLATEAVDD